VAGLLPKLKHSIECAQVFTATALATRLNLTQPSVTRAVQRGEKLAAEKGWRLEKLVNA
jgi:DNA-binding MarR family transcriptional regulator